MQCVARAALPGGFGTLEREAGLTLMMGASATSHSGVLTSNIDGNGHLMIISIYGRLTILTEP